MMRPWKIFHSDNGGEFTSNSVREVLKQLKIDDIQGTPYHPQSQGQIERFNRTIKSRIRKLLESDSIRYVDKLPEMLYQHNTSPHKATKISPFVLFFEYDPLGSNYGDLNRHLDVQQLRDQYLRYVEGYRLEYNNRFSTVEINIEDQVLIAKEFNPNLERRVGVLESYYMEDIYVVLTVYPSYIYVKLQEEGPGNPFSVHKRLIKKFGS
ncbi:Pro-Pol polyprotein [Cucumispora dikerogammari]|nr:Pro-Pol polyprotein [Cucumispora dikerogammari]